MPGRPLTALWWWIDRWRKSTAYTDMTLTEQGAYRNLLDEGWLRGGPLPADEQILAKACGDPRVWKQVRRKVLGHFYTAADGLRNTTLDEVLHQSERRAAKQHAYRARLGETGGHDVHSHGNDIGNDLGNDNGHTVSNTPGNNPGNNLSNNLSNNPSNNPGNDPGSPSPSLYVQAKLGTDGVPVDGGELYHSSPPAVLLFPTVGPVKQWALTTDQVAGWTAAYPNLDIVSECHHALAWIVAAPDRRKTARGMARFLVNWLNRAVDHRGAPRLSGPAPTVGALNADYVRRRRGQP